MYILLEGFLCVFGTYGMTESLLFFLFCREGLDFYSRVHENVSKLRKRVVEVMGTRSRERENVER